jgi:hypothetical protein
MNLSAVNANIVSRADKQRAPRMENTAKQIGYERTFETRQFVRQAAAPSKVDQAIGVPPSRRGPSSVTNPLT